MLPLKNSISYYNNYLKSVKRFFSLLLKNFAAN